MFALFLERYTHFLLNICLLAAASQLLVSSLQCSTHICRHSASHHFRKRCLCECNMYSECTVYIRVDSRQDRTREASCYHIFASDRTRRRALVHTNRTREEYRKAQLRTEVERRKEKKREQNSTRNTRLPIDAIACAQTIAGRKSALLYSTVVHFTCGEAAADSARFCVPQVPAVAVEPRRGPLFCPSARLSVSVCLKPPIFLSVLFCSVQLSSVPTLYARHRQTGAVVRGSGSAPLEVPYSLIAGPLRSLTLLVEGMRFLCLVSSCLFSSAIVSLVTSRIESNRIEPKDSTSTSTSTSITTSTSTSTTTSTAH